MFGLCVPTQRLCPVRLSCYFPIKNYKVCQWCGLNKLRGSSCGGRERKDSYLSLAAFHNDELLLRGSPSKDNLGVVLQDLVNLVCGHVLQVGAVDHASFGIPGWARDRVTVETKWCSVRLTLGETWTGL